MIFISYRRHWGYELAHLVDDELRSRGLRTFIDVADSDPGRFWPQAQSAIHSCKALVLICTNGSFETKPGDDWVQREVDEAMTLGRPIVPVFSKDFRPPAALPPPLAKAIEYNGVSMDTQFHEAAFDHLSQLVGGRKRSEQRKRVVVLGGLGVLTLLAALALGYGEIISLRKTAANDRRAAEQREQRANDEAVKREQDREAARQRAEERQQWDAKIRARNQAEDQEEKCVSGCNKRRDDCENYTCASERFATNGSCSHECSQQVDDCKKTCEQTANYCKDDCVEALKRACSDCTYVR